MTLQLELLFYSRTYSNLLRSHGKPDLADRWDKYAKEKMLKRSLEMLSTKAEMKKSKIVTLCHGDPW